MQSDKYKIFFLLSSRVFIQKVVCYWCWCDWQRDIQELLILPASHCLILQSFSLEKTLNWNWFMFILSVQLPMTVTYKDISNTSTSFVTTFWLNVSPRRNQKHLCVIHTKRTLTSEEICSPPLLSVSYSLVRGRHSEIVMPCLPEDKHLQYVAHYSRGSK